MAKDKDKQELKPHVVASLDELRPYTAQLLIQVIGADGILQEMSVPVRTIPYPEYLALGASVPDAPLPVSGFDRLQRPIYNDKDAGYIAAQSNVNAERNFRRLRKMLALPIPGETEDEQLEYLRGLDTNMIRQLFIGIRALAEMGEAAIQQQADTFRPNGNGRAMDTVEASDSEG